MMKRHTTHLDEFDEIESLDDLGDTLEGFSAVSLDSLDRIEYGDATFCDFGYGDKEGFCIRERFGCSIVGCDHADND
jgi:hypothetical protein